MKKKIFITGGLGFIGSNLIEVLLKKKFKIINLDLCSYASNKNLNINFKKNKNYKFIKGNIGDDKKVKKILNYYKPNYILNIAAETHVDNSIKFPIKFITHNILNYAKFLETIRDYYNFLPKKKKLLKIIHVSTDEVYGSLKNNEKSFLEKNKFYPNSPYSASKASSDLISRAWNKTFNLPIVVTNCANNYGKYQNEEKLIPKVILNILKNKTIPIYAKGKNVREWIYVNDHVDAILHLMRKGKIGETYNIGSGKCLSNISLVKKICDIMDRKLKKINHPSKNLIRHVRDRKAHDFKYQVNFNKLKKLKWKIKIDFNKGLEKTINWYIKKFYE
tara:strand:+ start:466 stop:1464 length:999 start_codon:yes stop_codon:yes gene_type:complete